MSDDLISRKALIEKLEEWCGNQKYLIPEEVIVIIQNTPTAFDKEKVMAKLRSEYMDASNMYSRLRGTAHSYSSECGKMLGKRWLRLLRKAGLDEH